MTLPRRGIYLVLPPGWTRVPLQDVHDRHAVIDRLVAATGLDDGPGAQVRRQLRDQLRSSVDDAARAGAVIFALATTGPSGVPLPASLIVSPLSVDPAKRDSTWWASANADLGRTAESDVALLPIGRVARRVHHEPAQPDVPASLRVDYWMTPLDDCGAYHCAMSTPLVAHSEAMVGLFDAVVSTAHLGAEV